MEERMNKKGKKKRINKGRTENRKDVRVELKKIKEWNSKKCRQRKNRKKDFKINNAEGNQN